MPGIKVNFIYNIVLTLASYIIGFIIFPYVSRVLGVENVGKIGFVNNVINYFSLFAYFGVKSLAVREIAACGNNREKRSDVFSSIAGFLIISTIIVSVLYFIAIFSIPRFQEDKQLLIIGSMSLIFTSFLLEWLFQGLENFRYVAIRSILIRIIYVIAIFLLVKTADDYIIYYILTVLTVFVNAIINIVYSRKFVDFSFRRVRIRCYLKPIFSLGFYNIMVSMYTTFNVIFLGFVCSNYEVGYYSTSIKLYTIILGIFSAFTGVMLPRISSLLSEGNTNEVSQKIKSSFEIVLSTSLPLAAYCFVMASDIIKVMAGSGYEGAVAPMRIIMMVFILTSMAQVWVLQVLMPMKKDGIILRSSILGAVVGIVLNFLIVKQWGAMGTAIVLLSSELVGNAYSFSYVIRHKLIKFPIKTFIICLANIIPYVFFAIVSHLIIGNPFFCIILSGIISVLYFFIFNTVIYPNTYIGDFMRNFLLRK